MSRYQRAKLEQMLGATYNAWLMPWLVFGPDHRRVGTRIIKDKEIIVNGKAMIGHQVVRG